MSVCIGFNIEGGRGRRGKPRGALQYLRDREEEEEEDDTKHKETPTTRASPFIVHNTSLFAFLSQSLHLVYSNQLFATEALDNRFGKTKRVGSEPLPTDRERGGTEEGGGASRCEKGSIPTG